MKKTKVRFNLGRGTKYMKWKVENASGSKYYEPSEVTLIMTNCKLVNRKKGAKKIFDGANKNVVAWVECEDVQVLDRPITLNESSDKVSYNPRVTPNWVLNEEDVDGQVFDNLFTMSRNVMTPKT